MAINLCKNCSNFIHLIFQIHSHCFTAEINNLAQQVKTFDSEKNTKKSEHGKKKLFGPYNSRYPTRTAVRNCDSNSDPITVPSVVSTKTIVACGDIYITNTYYIHLQRSNSQYSVG